MPQIFTLNLFGVYNGGLNTRDDPRALPLHKSPYLRNVELRRNRVETTPGYTAHSGTDSDTAANSGIFVARYSGNVYLLKAENGKIKKLKVVGSSPDSAWGTLKTGLNATARVEFAQAGNVVYATNGVNTVQKWDLATTPASTADVVAIPKGKTIAYFNQRLVVSHETDGSRFDFSNVGAYETFPGNFKYADQGEGGTIQRLLDTGRGQLLIMKDTGSGRYTWDGVDTSTSNPKKWSDRGTVAPRSVVMLPSGSVAFCDHEGVWLASLFEYGETPLSGEIEPTWQALNHGKLDLAAATYFDEQLLISVAESGQTTNNVTLAFDFQLADGGGWLIHDIPATAWASYIDSSGVPQIIFGDPSANSRLFRRYQGLTASEFNFNGAAINAVYHTKEHDFHEVAPDAAGRTKIMLKKSVSTEQKGDYNLTLGWRKDNDSDFNEVLWNLLGTGTSLWSETPSDVWPEIPAPDDIWEGTQKVEGLVPSFKLRGRTEQSKVAKNAVNEPFTYFGETIHFIPLKSFT